MSLTILSPAGRRLTFDGKAILIGREAGCDLRLPDGPDDNPSVRPQHARVRKVANRWMLESAGEWLVQAGSSPPGKTCWLHPGDVIRL